jgi:cytochrome d ubiquinol oxidase subunit I
MTDLLAARSQMAISLAFHIVFAIVGMGMPLLMVIAEGMWLRTRDQTYLILAQRWSKGTAIMFAVGAVSGTVLSFELGLLWPEFMAFAGPIIGMPFSLEGFAFFFEAIFLGIYLYGWDRTPPLVHWLMGVGVWVSGMASGAFVVAANAWMNSPQGWSIDEQTGELLIDPFAAMFNDAMPSEALHMSTAAIVSMAFGACGIHAWYLLKDRTSVFHQRALGVALPVAIVGSLLQPLTGHRAAEYVAHAQPAKLAAAEAQWETMRAAPLRIGGWPDEEAEQTHHDLEIPYLLSILAFGDPQAEVIGLKDIPVDERPPVAVVHLAYQVMLGLGMFMMLVGLTGGGLWARRRTLPLQRWYLRLLVLCGPAGFLAVEAGWTVTEVGRQPWIIRGVMRTSEAVTPVTGIALTLWLYTALYVVLAVLVVALLRRQFNHAPDLGHEAVPEEVP